jgi:hypothetical protein
MRRLLIILIIALCLVNCSNENEQKSNKLVGTWKMIYAEIIENDSLKIKDLTNTSFIKIINDSHFSFFNQEKNSSNNFYGGAGTYTLDGSLYIETLNYTAVNAIKNHTFPFTIRFKGDTLIQSGIEEIKEAGIKRKIIEKYIRVN